MPVAHILRTSSVEELSISSSQPNQSHSYDLPETIFGGVDKLALAIHSKPRPSNSDLSSRSSSLSPSDISDFGFSSLDSSLIDAAHKALSAITADDDLPITSPSQIRPKTSKGLTKPKSKIRPPISSSNASTKKKRFRWTLEAQTILKSHHRDYLPHKKQYKSEYVDQIIKELSDIGVTASAKQILNFYHNLNSRKK
ncbi:hypothetical protein ADUPG1_005926 [Aduncisulcus paluster]|uniref:Uncharacterized protein n=1 Tax=Aduncisulcus paluster TaxID=2918883 RepID=A0ABQ5KG45_9EUKA|nr:hypothetical protein ADUPG1_005926 [Aduncisulcus paluster]|eukprot:gnl/Carplike_NY0171/2701_a3630_565.p1 GENE.gnl/Carplike_NY0171/2701_a3630_565~~gnl/Carplike_NY0171/2701_a3630_565.p1  ORF type:complete len:197 (+),score=31.36 gnl/Carplike_NY0171/2701_a3630_565:107-697(+)